MAHTYLVAAFDRSNEAEQAKRELMGIGVSQTNIKLTASNDDNISGFFRSIFTDANSQRNADVYSEAVRHGATVVTVFAEDAQASMIEKIMESNGAIDVNERSASWGRESTGERTAIPVVEEELKVGKRESTLGSVRVTSHVTERPVEERVKLTEQHVVIERHPVDRPATPEDLAAFKEGTIELQETAEEAVVSKSARVVEEVVLGKETTQHEETIRDTVRRTDVDIEKTGSASTHRAFGSVSVHEEQEGGISAHSEKVGSASVHGEQKGGTSVHSEKVGRASVHGEQRSGTSVHSEKKASASVHGEQKGGTSVHSEKKASASVHSEQKGGTSARSEKKASASSVHAEKKGSASHTETKKR